MHAEIPHLHRDIRTEEGGSHFEIGQSANQKPDLDGSPNIGFVFELEVDGTGRD